MRLPSIPRLALGATLSTYFLMVLGGYVSKSGAGLACPDWPLCHGQLIPPLEGGVVAEWGHRLAALLVVLFTILLALAAWRANHPHRRLPRIALGLLGVQVALGGATIHLKLHPLIVTSHLAVALLFFGTLVFFSGLAVARPEKNKDQ